MVKIKRRFRDGGRTDAGSTAYLIEARCFARISI